MPDRPARAFWSPQKLDFRTELSTAGGEGPNGAVVKGGVSSPTLARGARSGGQSRGTKSVIPRRSRSSAR